MSPSREPQHALAVIDQPAGELAVRKQELDQGAARLASRARSDNTWKAYKSDWRIFEAFCREINETSMPASVSTLCRFITELHAARGRKLSTIQRLVASISQAHELAKQSNPRLSAEVREVLKGLRRSPGARKIRKADALLPARMRAMLTQLPATPRGLRDRAILLLGMSTGLRRSEIVKLEVPSVRFVREGMLIDLGVTKTDQEGTHEPLPVLYGARPDACPVRSLQDWIACLDQREGPLFVEVTPAGRIKKTAMSDRAVSRLLKRLGKAIGLSDEQIASLSGHSLRAGFITTAAKLGTPTYQIKKISRHKSDAILAGYIRDADQWTDNATKGITDADF